PQVVMKAAGVMFLDDKAWVLAAANGALAARLGRLFEVALGLVERKSLLCHRDLPGLQAQGAGAAPPQRSMRCCCSAPGGRTIPDGVSCRHAVLIGNDHLGLEQRRARLDAGKRGEPSSSQER